MEFVHKRLPNGLTLIAEQNPDAHTSAVGFFVKAGARDEEPVVMGVSHFLEHMMFKGTDRRSADDINRGFDQIGANYNAFTSHENTVYWAHVLPEYLSDAVDLLGDMLRPALRPEDFDLEKNVILEEIGMYEDRPQWRLNDVLLERYFGELPLGHRVLGTVETIKDLTVEQMNGYFRQRYSPSNITVAAAGRFDIDELFGLIEAAAGSWDTEERPERNYPDVQGHDAELTIEDSRVNRHYISMMCPAPSTQDDRRYAAKVLADVLGDTEGSRLYWALVDPGLADDADISFHPQDEVGAYLAYASCTPDRAAKVEKALLQTLDSFASNIDDAEIERAKNKLATGATLHGESPGGRMRNLGAQWTYLGRYMPLEEELDKLMAVTHGDVASLAEQMPFKPRTIVRLTPK